MADTTQKSREPSFLRSLALASATLAILTTVFGGLYLRAEDGAGGVTITASR